MAERGNRMGAATEVETVFVPLLCQCCGGYRKGEEMEEEETAAFEQGLLQYNLDNACLGCLQGKVCDEVERRLLGTQGALRLGLHFKAWLAQVSWIEFSKSPVSVTALAKYCWYTLFPLGSRAVLL